MSKTINPQAQRQKNQMRRVLPALTDLIRTISTRTMTTNRAAYLTAVKAHPLEVGPAPTGTPGVGQILIKNSAIAINPIDNKLQKFAIYPLAYPAILGEDVAGTVVSVGPNAPRFKEGDRVMGAVNGFGSKNDTEMAFQEYTVLDSNLSGHVPESIPFEQAVQMPLAITTAAAGLFNQGHLGLQLPTEPAQASTGKAVLVWGGASSVGLAAIQLTKAAGYEVLTTSSSKNFSLVKRVGADHVVDYKSSTAVEDLLAALGDKELAGVYDAIGGSAWASCAEIAQKAKGAKKVASAVRGFPDPPEGVEMTPVFSISIKDNGVGKAVWGDYVEKALKAGTFIPASEIVVAGKGLESIQTGIDLLAKGVSAQKIVVQL